MPIAELETLIDATTQNTSQFKGLTAAYEYLGFGVPTIDGYTFLINENNDTNFGAETPTSPGPVFNDENIYINTMNALYQGNPDAKASFDAIVGAGATLQDKLSAVYDSLIPVAERTDAGRAFFISQSDFYVARAAELGIPGLNGAALVGAAALIKIAVDNDLPGLGDSINDLLAAVDDGSAVIPQDGALFTPIETADGTNFDADDVSTNTGGTFNLTAAVGEIVDGTAGDDTFNGVIGTDGTANVGDTVNGLGGNDTLNLIVGPGAVGIPAGFTSSSVEIVNIDQTSANLGAPFSASSFAGATEIWQIGDVVDISGVGADTTAGFRNVEADVTVTFTGATGNIALDNVADGSDLVIAGNSITALNVSGTVDDDGLTPPNPGELNLSTSITTTGALEVINLTLTSDAVVTIDGNFRAIENLATFDASASTGDIEFLSLNDGEHFINTVLMGSGSDHLYYDTDYTNGGDGGGTVTIDLGAGSDELELALYNNDTTDNNTLVEVSLGDGNDLVEITEQFENITDATEANFADGIASILDFNVTEDVLDISDFATIELPSPPLSNVQQADIADEANLFDAVSKAATFAEASGNTDVVLFDFGGNAYVYHDTDDSQTFTDNDGLIELVGVSIAQLSGANFVIA